MNASPLLALGGRAPGARWGTGSLQEIDHVPFVAPLTKLARTANSTPRSPGLCRRGVAAAVTPPSGPAFIDFPMDQVFMEADVDADSRARCRTRRRFPPPTATRSTAPPNCCALRSVRSSWRARVCTGARRAAAQALCEELQIPVFLNGLARGCVPADHPQSLLRARGAGLKGADVALVVGVPMDFRLGFGGAFGDDTQLIAIGSALAEREHRARWRRSCTGTGRARSTRCAPPAARIARPG